MPCLAVKMFVTCHWLLVKVWSEGLNSIWPRLREGITCLHYRGMIPGKLKGKTSCIILEYNICPLTNHVP